MSLILQMKMRTLRLKKVGVQDSANCIHLSLFGGTKGTLGLKLCLLAIA